MELFFFFKRKSMSTVKRFDTCLAHAAVHGYKGYTVNRLSCAGIARLSDIILRLATVSAPRPFASKDSQSNSGPRTAS